MPQALKSEDPRGRGLSLRKSVPLNSHGKLAVTLASQLQTMDFNLPLRALAWMTKSSRRLLSLLSSAICNVL